MKKFIGIVLATLMSATVAVAQDSNLEGFRVLESKIMDASMHRNSAELDKLLAADYVSIDIAGHIRSRSEIIRDSTSGSIAVTSVHSEPQTVRQYGPIAIVVGFITLAGTNHGKDISGKYAFTRVYKNDAGTWRAVSFESTPVK
jgi:hypothetical protein